ncbi:hypothetical protein CPB86DRAFT_710921 [Serendipita vermifera]|nr:hypothetical protein CPB86DRAFT_710921 [Serendipita vermifera]
MSGEEDDYLSDKFLQQISSNSRGSTSKTYSQRRKDAQKQSEIRNLAGRTKSRKELEKEALETLKEGMSTSLFEREKLATAAGGTESKAMKMMSKMGYKAGEALGRRDTSEPNPSGEGNTSQQPKARVAPIPINMWEGKKGLGSIKRPLSPDSVANELERAAKTARTQEVLTHDEFRSRNRLEYEEKRDEGRLSSAQKTCAVLDEKAGIPFNILSINPYRPKLIPPELLAQLDIPLQDEIDDTFQSRSQRRGRRWDALERLDDEQSEDQSAIARRLRQEMKRDALVGSKGLEEDSDEELHLNGEKNVLSKEDSIHITPEIVEQAREFLEQPVKERLERVLKYLREKYNFCFWCGTEYKSKDEMDASCPGETEESHD